MKILVADDSKTNLALITASLIKLGHEVLPAKNGGEAIEIFRSARPDLVILDVVMEGLNGFEVAKMLRAIDSEDWVPIIFLSASVDDESIAKGINAGGDDYLTKPFSEITLAAKIKAMQRISDMRKKLYETTLKLQVLSATDTLTGIYNRFHFDRTIKEKIAHASRHQCSFALLFIDLDHFKSINDSLGHPIGDLLLKNVAKRLSSCLRIDDFIARMGGDEFSIILSEIESPEIVDAIAEKILHTLLASYMLAGNEVHITCSIGVAFYPLNGTDQDTLIQNADIAMYHAKDLGRNNVQYFTDELHAKRKHQVTIEDALKFALERKELDLRYQPIFDLAQKKLVGIEALLQWTHPDLGTVPPNIFMPIADDIGLTDQITQWVLYQACRQASVWYKANHRDFKLSVNISPHQLLQKNFIQLLVETLRENNFPAKLLELELTESSVLTYSNISQKTIQEIHEMNITIALDDFGTGYSSSNHLSRLPIHTIKIDKSFIQNITSSTRDAMIVKSVISLGKNLGFNVVAEGIEKKEQLQFLLKNDCPQGQGFYLVAPQRAEQISFDMEVSSGVE